MGDEFVGKDVFDRHFISFSAFAVLASLYSSSRLDVVECLQISDYIRVMDMLVLIAALIPESSGFEDFYHKTAREAPIFVLTSSFCEPRAWRRSRKAEDCEPPSSFLLIQLYVRGTRHSVQTS
jgi:hypothetical protein